MMDLGQLIGNKELLKDPGFQKGLKKVIQEHFIEQYFNGGLGDKINKRVQEKHIDSVLSDINLKFAKRMANKKEPFTEKEVYWISRLAGKSEEGLSPFDWGDDEGITSEQLEGYASHLRNYLYTYKDEAREIDPSIDPHEAHKGPMAQDIEQVAPDCVKETPEGVKTVDGSRLALVNAGVIGELARRVLELEEKINGRNE